MVSIFIAQAAILIASGLLFYRMLVSYQREDARQRRLFNATLEFAQQLGMYECREFLAVAQTGDQAELERRWKTWADHRDAALRGDYSWGIA